MKIPGGWSQTPNEIIAAMPVMSGSEFRCTMVLIRETYGYHRRRVKLTYEDFGRQTGIEGRETLAAALKAVNSRGFFLRNGGQSKWMIGGGCVNEEGEDSLINKPRMAVNSSKKEVRSSIIEQNELTESSKIELSESINSSKIELSESINSSKIELSESINSSKIELSESIDSSKIELLPLYKERSPTGKERERERKRPTAHPAVPSPRSAAERELAAHPAAGMWMEAGMTWPGWHRMKIITKRLGEKPEIEALKKARELWLMAGYRKGNIGGILDWYEAICRDSAWRPFGKTTGHGRPPPKGDGPGSPTMTMLLRMKEERLHGR